MRSTRIFRAALAKGGGAKALSPCDDLVSIAGWETLKGKRPAWRYLYGSGDDSAAFNASQLHLSPSRRFAAGKVDNRPFD